MNEMTLSSRHRIRNSGPGDLRPSTLPHGHEGSPQYSVLHVDGEKHFCFFQTAETENRTPNSSVKGSGANHYPRAPARRLSRLTCRVLVALVCGQSCNFRVSRCVTRHVPNRADVRVGVFCT